MCLEQHDNQQNWKQSETDIIPPPNNFSDYTERVENKGPKYTDNLGIRTCCSPRTNQCLTFIENRNPAIVRKIDIKKLAATTYNSLQISYMCK